MGKKIALLILAAGGVGLLIWSHSRYSRMKEAQGWPTAEAEIVSSEIESHRRRSRSSSRSRTREVTMYTPVVEYEYNVNGEIYTSSRVSFFDGSSTARFDARGVVDKYPQGKVVSAYYDPDNPQNSVLETEETGNIFYLSLIFGFGFILMGITGFIFADE